MISTRIISALILGLIFFLSFFNTNEIYFLAFSLILCFLALAELNNILFKNKSFLFLFISLLFLCLAFFQIPNPKLIAIMSLLFWFIYAPFFIFKNYKINFLHKYLLGIFLISNLFYSIFFLYGYDKQLLLFSLIFVWISDISAYFIGRKYGKHKLAPFVSPGKTVEGAIGAFIICIIVSLLFAIIFDFSVLNSVFLAIIISFFSVIGDLFESQLKREANIKDSGFLIPGHGGILDRLDGLCSSIPIVFFIAIFYLK